MLLSACLFACVMSDCLSVSAGEQHVKSGKYFQVRYEDACADPVGALSPVLSSLGT